MGHLRRAGLVEGGDRRLARQGSQGGPKTGPSPVDRETATTSPKLIPLIQTVPPERGWRGRPRQRPVALYADRGYDHDTYRKPERALGITVVEQSFALQHWFRRLRIRREIRDAIHEAFLSLATEGVRRRGVPEPPHRSRSRRFRQSVGTMAGQYASGRRRVPSS